jgi:hypothetical protein
MKTANEKFRQRLSKNRPMTTVSIRMPEDVIEDLKDLAPAFGFSGYQPLIRAYIGQGMRKHEMELENSSLDALTESLRRQGVEERVIAAAIQDAKHTTA